jgi:hypothetical protein
MKANNLAMGLGLAVLGFALVRYFRGQSSSASSASAAAFNAPNAGAVWQTLTFPLGQATGGVNMTGGLDQVYSSMSWNPDALSAQIGNDTAAAMGAAGMPDINQYGFHL